MGKSQQEKRQLEIESLVIHAGGEPDAATGAVMPPLYQVSTYAQKSPGQHQGYEYTRSHNPTRTRLQTNLAALEGANHALCTSSGMAAITLIMHALPAQSVILCSDDVYGGTYRLFTTVFAKIHQFHFIDMSDKKLAVAQLKKIKPHLLWLESPTNPMLKICDIAALSKEAKTLNCVTVVDNTFLSPIFQRPLNLGADIVVHSTTKYINGHSDVLGGCLMLNSKEWYEKLWKLQNSIGPTPSPFDSWLTLRGIKTLAIRMQAHEKNAKLIAQFLSSHPKITQVIYPGLSSHPQYSLMRKQTSGFGGMISLVLKGDFKKTQKFLATLELFTLAESLGGVESLVNHPATMTHASIPKDIRERLGITENLIRLSVGIENSKDLIWDLDQALDSL